MGRTAPRSGPCLAPHLPPAPPLHPAIPAGRFPPWRSDHRSRRHRRRWLSPSSGRSPQPSRAVSSPGTLRLRVPFPPSPTVSLSLPSAAAQAPLRHRSIVLHRHHLPAFRLVASLRSASNQRPRGPTSSSSPVLPPGTPLLPSQSHFNFCASRFAAGLSAPISAALRFPLQSLSPPLASLAARSACRKPRSPTASRPPTRPRPLLRPAPTRPSPVAVPPPLRSPPPPPRPIAAATPHRRSRRPRWPDRSCTSP